MTPDERIDDVALRLARDATSWGGEPSEAARLALRARLAMLPPNRRVVRRWLPLLVAACALVVALLAWHRVRGTSRLPVRHDLPVESLAVVHNATDRALAPLRSELAGLTQDAEALARGIWTRVPAPLRRLVR